MEFYDGGALLSMDITTLFNLYYIIFNSDKRYMFS
jgi:hypothetical protein